MFEISYADLTKRENDKTRGKTLRNDYFFFFWHMMSLPGLLVLTHIFTCYLF